MKKVMIISFILFSLGLISACGTQNNNMRINDLFNIREDNIDKEYKVFENITNPSYIGTYNDLDNFYFTEYNGPVILYMTPYYMETNYGTVYIHTKDIVYIYKEGKAFYYQVNGNKDFSFLFKE